MMIFTFLQEKKKYIEIKVVAENVSEAIDKVNGGDYDAADVREDEYYLPSSDYETVLITDENGKEYLRYNGSRPPEVIKDAK